MVAIKRVDTIGEKRRDRFATAGEDAAMLVLVIFPSVMPGLFAGCRIHCVPIFQGFSEVTIVRGPDNAWFGQANVAVRLANSREADT